MRTFLAAAAAFLILVPPASGHSLLRSELYRTDPCLAQIIDRENPSWNPRQYNLQGSGAYGLPQALPGWKMQSAGADWRTNPYTQLRWAAQYCRQRYGGSCAAWAFWQRHHYY